LVFGLWHIQFRALGGWASIVFGNVVGLLSSHLDSASCESVLPPPPTGWFNVYSYVANPYMYGGIGAVSLTMAILGCFYAVLVYFAQRIEGYPLALLSCFIYPLLMAFYAWQFSLTTFVYLAIVLIPLFSHGWRKKSMLEVA
jgi:hypothetical protein